MAQISAIDREKVYERNLSIRLRWRLPKIRKKREKFTILGDLRIIYLCNPVLGYVKTMVKNLQLSTGNAISERSNFA